MGCGEYRLLISKYVDGEANDEEQARLEKHLAHCRRCLRVVSEFRLVNSRFAAIQRREPEPGGRQRLLARLERMDSPRTEEISITRRQEPAITAPQPAPRWAGLLGTVATGFAMLVVGLTGLVLWQMIGVTPAPAENGPILPNADATVPAALATHPPEIAGAGKAGTAGPVATWYAAPEATGVVTHTVRDERFGYKVDYAANWWTARIAPGDSGAQARRAVRPWPLKGRSEHVEVALEIRVYENPGAGSRQQILERLSHEPAEVAPASYGELDGLQAWWAADGARIEEAYLFHERLTYHFRLSVQGDGRVDDASVEEQWRDASAELRRVLESFVPDRNATKDGPGVAPLLFVTAGDLWMIKPGDGNAAARITTDGKTRDFSVSPDLSHVALVKDASEGSRLTWGRIIEVRPLVVGGAGWSLAQAEVHDVAWYDDKQLIAITAAESEYPLGIYRMDRGLTAMQPLARLGNLDDGGRAAGNLQVSPDRLWISFISGEGEDARLYKLSKEGGLPVEVPCIEEKQGPVSDYGWLEPNASDGSQRLVVLAGNQLERVKVSPNGRHSPECDVLDERANADVLAVSPEGRTAYLTREHALKVVATGASDFASSPTRAAYTPAAKSSRSLDLAWLANSNFLAIQEASGNTVGVRLLDLDRNLITELFSGK